jgi:hypothetical protein
MKPKQNVELSRGAGIPFAAFLAMAILSACTGALAEDWQNYKPAHSLGSASDDWWTSAVEHPPWILESLKENPVIVFLHQENCESCKNQTANISAVLEMYPQSVILFDIMADWKDPRFIDFNNTYQPQFVPTTIFLTRAEGSDGKTLTIWHSEEDAMSQGRIKSFVKDAIYYYQKYASRTS